MPRPRKTARLHFRPAREGRAATWVILDGGKEFSTGCGESDLAGAEAALQRHIEGKQQTASEAIRSQRDPNDIKVADAISVYWTKHVNKPGKELSRPKAIKARLDSLLDESAFGLLTVGQCNGEAQEKYVYARASSIAEEKEDKEIHECQAAPRRELEDLQSAINFALRQLGGASYVFRAVLPDPNLPRLRWLSRTEAARLIRAAWRARELRNGKVCGRHTARHIARFILIGLYTGSRAGDISNAALMPTVGRGFVDLDDGIFQRKPDNKRETNKKQPTIPLPSRLLAHIRRWKRLGISNHSVIEFNGKPIERINYRTWDDLVAAAGLASDDPRQKVVRHTLRHTSISWMLRAGVSIEKVSDYCGVSAHIIKTVYKHHLPGNFDDVLDAANKFGKTGKRRS